MNRQYVLLFVVAALMLGVYLYDRANRTETLIAATVVSVESRMANEGPDTWHITVETKDGPQELEPWESRPNLSTGDKVCVRVITRMGRADEMRLDTSNATC